jgi:hypothetical protein
MHAGLEPFQARKVARGDPPPLPCLPEERRHGEHCDWSPGDGRSQSSYSDPSGSRRSAGSLPRSRGRADRSPRRGLGTRVAEERVPTLGAFLRHAIAAGLDPKKSGHHNLSFFTIANRGVKCKGLRSGGTRHVPFHSLYRPRRRQPKQLAVQLHAVLCASSLPSLRDSVLPTHTIV